MKTYEEAIQALGIWFSYSNSACSDDCCDRIDLQIQGMVEMISLIYDKDRYEVRADGRRAAEA